MCNLSGPFDDYTLFDDDNSPVSGKARWGYYGHYSLRPWDGYSRFAEEDDNCQNYYDACTNCGNTISEAEVYGDA